MNDYHRCKSCSGTFNGSENAVVCSSHCNNRLMMRPCDKDCLVCNKYYERMKR